METLEGKDTCSPKRVNHYWRLRNDPFSASVTAPATASQGSSHLWKHLRQSSGGAQADTKPNTQHQQRSKSLLGGSASKNTFVRIKPGTANCIAISQSTSKLSTLKSKLFMKPPLAGMRTKVASFQLPPSGQPERASPKEGAGAMSSMMRRSLSQASLPPLSTIRASSAKRYR